MMTRKKAGVHEFLGSNVLVHIGLLAAVLLLPTLCGTGCDTLQPTSSGAGGDFGPPGAAPAEGLDGPMAAPLQAPRADGVEQVVRDIEEADIVKVVGDRIYALNRFKGLLIIDVADPDAPRLAGSLDLSGRGVEMFVVGQQVYVLLSASFYHPHMFEGMDMGLDMGMDMGMPVPMDMDAGFAGAAIMPDGTTPPLPDFEGSQLAIVDATDAAAPALQGKLNLVGYANESRRVGDVIYVIGRNPGAYWYGQPEEEEEWAAGFVASVNVADPANIVAVQREPIAGNALVMHVSETAIFAASEEYDPDAGGMQTNVQVIDISDPAGTIVSHGSVNVPGRIDNRFHLDDYQGVLRIVTESWGFGFLDVRLFTYDLSDPDNITALGETEIIQGESLRAVRFDGPRGYVVTFLQVDPLFVVDLTDPAAPTVSGFLEVPGFSTHIVPHGDRLIAVGIDDTDGRRPAISYYDVADPANPTELGRVVLGPPGSFTDSEAVYDEKAFKIVDELGLIAMPFKYVDYGQFPELLDVPLVGLDEAGADEILPDEDGGPVCLNAVQLVDFDDLGLSQRGWFEHRGRVERVGVIGDRIFALSQAGLKTVDISNRDDPMQAGVAEFFDGEDVPYYADDCAGFDIPWELPPDWPPGPGMPGTPGSLELLLQIFLDGNMCGMMGGAPFLGGLIYLGFLRMRVVPRGRCRGRRRGRRNP